MKSANNDIESAFNEGMLQIQRLHELWTQANRQSRDPKDIMFTQWRFTLETIWRELSRDALKEQNASSDPETYFKEQQENGWFRVEDKFQALINNANTPHSRYAALKNYDMFLRRLQDVVGKGGKFRDKDEDDME